MDIKRRENNEEKSRRTCFQGSQKKRQRDYSANQERD
jgi:hypothetical protein